MKKSTLLCLGMLFGTTVGGYSQVSIKDYAALKGVRDSLANVTTYETELTGLQNAETTLQVAANNIDAVKVERIPTQISWEKGSLEKQHITDFYHNVLLGNEGDALVIRREVRTGFGAGLTLYIYSPEQATTGITDIAQITTTGLGDGAGTIISGNNKLKNIIFYLKDINGDYTTTIVNQTASDNTDEAVLAAVLSAANNIGVVNQSKTEIIEIKTRNENYLTTWQSYYNNINGQNRLKAWLDGGTWKTTSIKWKNSDDTTSGEVELTVKDNEAHPGCRNYSNLKLTDNIEITDDDFSMGVFAADCVFDGDNKAITYIKGSSNTNTLFDANYGKISNVKLYNCNLVAGNAGTINNVEIGVTSKGTIASSNSGRIMNSIDNPSETVYNVYGSNGSTACIDGKDASQYSKIYNNETLRNEFGVNVVNGNVKKGSEYKLYKVTAYSAKVKDGESHIVNIDANGNNTTNPNNNWQITAKDGAFYYVNDFDAAKDIFDKITDDKIASVAKNVVYTADGDNWKCKKAEVSNSEDTPIYIHQSFYAETVTYDRTFDMSAGGASTICLPFDVDESELRKVVGANGKLLQFNKVEVNEAKDLRTYWFKYVSGGMEANQPYILKFGEAVNGQIFNLSNVKFVTTGDANIAALEQSTEGVGASLFGVFKKQTASELEAGRYSVYGFNAQSGEFVRMTENVIFLPTRAYVRREGFISSASDSKPYKLGVLDENDNDVTGIETVENPSVVFTVKGGNGAIIVNSDMAQNVKVYTTGGALVKNVAVSAGEVSIPVSAGLYIVNGNKVVVK